MPRVFATLEELRLLEERSGMESGELKSGTTLQVQATVKLEAGAGIIAIPADGAHKLLITISYAAQVSRIEDKTLLLSYLSKYQGNFSIDELIGIDLKKGADLPVESIQTYVSQMEWAIRSRAQNTLVQYGFSGLALPKSNKFTSTPRSSD